MRATGSSVRTAGWSAGQRFKTLAKAWRRRALRPVFLACSGLVTGFAIAGTVVTGQAKFWLGALAGGTMALYIKNYSGEASIEASELRVRYESSRKRRAGPRTTWSTLAPFFPTPEPKLALSRPRGTIGRDGQTRLNGAST